MLGAENGNIEVMEIMALLNTTSGLDNFIIGNISIVNPFTSEEIQPSNEEILYSFNQLNRFNPMKDNKFQSGEIKMCKRFDLIHNKVRDIISLGTDLNWVGDLQPYEKIKSCISLFDNVANLTARDKIAKLEELKKMLESDAFSKHAQLDAMYTDSERLN
jgi:hypothetical protein